MPLEKPLVFLIVFKYIQLIHFLAKASHHLMKNSYHIVPQISGVRIKQQNQKLLSLITC